MTSRRPEVLSLITEGGLKLRAALYSPADLAGSPPAIVVCHGIPAIPYDPVDRGYEKLAEDLCCDGFITLLLNFRGAGLSEGNFDILGWTGDLVAAIDYLHAHVPFDKRRLSLLGFSGGAAVAIYVAAHDTRVSAVASCASPSSFKEINGEKGMRDLLEHSRKIGIIKDKDFPKSFAAWSHGFAVVQPAEWVGRISPRPLLILQGEADEVVPASQAQELYNLAGEPKELHILPGVGHRLRLDAKAMEIARGWLKRVNGL